MAPEPGLEGEVDFSWAITGRRTGAGDVASVEIGQVRCVPKAQNRLPYFDSIALAFCARLFVRAAVASHAVLEVTNAFFQVLSPDFLGIVLVATVTSVAPVIVSDVTCRASHIVIAIEHEVLGVIERHRFPMFRRMAQGAIALDVAVPRIVRRLVTGFAPLQDRLSEQLVIESCRLPAIWLVALLAADGDAAMNFVLRRGVAGLTAVAHVGTKQRMSKRLAAARRELRTHMTGVASYAISLDQGLMERGLRGRPGNRNTLCGAQTDFRDRVAGDAAFGRRAAKRHVTGKAIARQFGVLR